MRVAIIILFSFIVFIQGSLLLRKQLNYPLMSAGFQDYSQSEQGVLLP